MRAKTIIPAAILGLFALPALAAAQSEGRNHSLALYGLGAYLDGDMSLGELGSEVDVDADEIIKSLETAAMARYRGQTERWALVVDGIFAGLGASRQGPLLKEDLDVDMLIVHADAGWRFSEVAEVLFGVRYVRFEAQLDITGGPVDRRVKGDASFWDPVIGLRTVRPLSERWLLQAQGDVGGGANMDFTWQGMLHFGYKASDAVSVWLGYRGIGMDFDDSGGQNRFTADLLMHGPVAGVAFQF